MARIHTNMRKYFLDETAFNAIDTAAKAYWLGYLYCDGSVHSRKGYVMLGSEDVDIPAKFKVFLKADYPLYRYGRAGKELKVHSYPLKEALIAQGVVPCKTYVRSDVSIPDGELTRHFWRGCVDADGSVTTDKKVPWLVLNNTSTMLLERCARFFGCGSIQPNGSISRWVVSGMKALECMATLYDNVDSSIRMDRKYNRYLELKGCD